MKIIIFIVGIISMAVGFVGIFLPLIPTTPLILLALYCFGKSSQKFKNWLESTPMYKKHLEDFVQNKKMILNRKIILVSFATMMMMFPLIILDTYLIKIIIIITLLYLYYYFIFNIETI